MDTSLTRTDLTVTDDAPMTDAHRSAVVRLYLARLAWLLADDRAGGWGLTAEERRRLHSRAVLSTVRTLSALEAGPAASALLRRARPGNPPAPPGAN